MHKKVYYLFAFIIYKFLLLCIICSYILHNVKKIFLEFDSLTDEALSHHEITKIRINLNQSLSGSFYDTDELIRMICLHCNFMMLSFLQYHESVLSVYKKDERMSEN